MINFTGGLGGFGLELADWMVIRESRNIVLTTRTGVRNGYQAMRIRLWESYGAKVVISKADITTEEGVKQLLNEANQLGPVTAIFNLAVVSKKIVYIFWVYLTYGFAKLLRNFIEHICLGIFLSKVFEKHFGVFTF